MDIVWTKTPMAVIATLREYADDPRGEPTEPPTDQTKWRIALRLLSIGGKRVCIMDEEREGFRSWVASEGSPSEFGGVRVVRGAANECHRNCAELWRQNAALWSLVPGYALSDDGVWRQHTWLIDNTETLIETTVPRTAYYGVAIDGAAAHNFCDTIMRPNSPSTNGKGLLG